MKRKRHIDILRAITIILVVIGHSGGMPGTEWLSEHLPNSYMMAIFLFISGYLFKPIEWSGYVSFFTHKTKTLALPLIGWNIAYAAILTLMVKLNMADFMLTERCPSISSIWSIKNLLLEPFFSGHQYHFNLATWFVGMLYVALLVYAAADVLLRRLPGYLMLVIYALVALAGLYAAAYINYPRWVLLPVHVSYALFFLQFGRCWRQYVEPWLAHVNEWVVMACVLVAWAVMQSLIGGRYYITSWMQFDGRVVAPIVVGMLGCSFFVLLSRRLEPMLTPHNWLERYVGPNTWAIMTHHLIVKFMVIWTFLHLTHNAEAYAAFRQDFWYRPTFDLWALLALEVTLPILWQLAFDRLKQTGRTAIARLLQR